jgi:hypothetical protein
MTRSLDMSDGPKRDRAAYMRDRRAAEKAAEVARSQPSHRLTSRNVPKPGDKAEVAQVESKYDCGCRPDELCIQHGIAAMGQKQRDVLLDRIHKVREGADSAKLGSWEDAIRGTEP